MAPPSELVIIDLRLSTLSGLRSTPHSTMRNVFIVPALVWFVTVTMPFIRAADLEVEQQSDRVTIRVDGNLFAIYLTQSESRPAIWPILGPTGKEMTRAFPHRPASPSERSDHAWHRSLWFAHADVNGVDFWNEGRSGGAVKHREFLVVEGGSEATIVTANDWVNSDGERECSDLRALTFGAADEIRWIDFDITILAEDQEVVFGDNKDGCLGIRVAPTMKVEAEEGGRIVNNLGDADKQAWGKKASWVDYVGPIDSKTHGIAILNHPNSFRFPTYWHVRTYGLFAANPFGVRAFENAKDLDGSFTLPQGDSISLFYRIIIHTGDENEAGIHQRFLRYAKMDKISVLRRSASVDPTERDSSVGGASEASVRSE